MVTDRQIDTVITPPAHAQRSLHASLLVSCQLTVEIEQQLPEAAIARTWHQQCALYNMEYTLWMRAHIYAHACNHSYSIRSYLCTVQTTNIGEDSRMS